MSSQTGVSPFNGISNTSAIALYSGVITFTGAGQGITLDPQKMQNPANKAMLIDEVRFISVGDATNLIQYGSVLYAKFRVNRQALTKEYVPVWTLGASQNITWNTNSRNLETYVYKPPVPIYVPKFTNLQCDLKVDPTAWGINTFSQSFSFIVVYVGRQIDDVNFAPPSEVDVPWIGHYIPPSFEEGVLAPTERSTANDLSSPFAEPLRVKSLIGRILFGPGDAFFSYPAVVNKCITIKIMNVNGAIVTRDPTPFGHLFDSITREWSMDTLMDRNSYLIASVTSDMREVNTGLDLDAYVNLAMHGYRTVTLREYMS